MRIQIVHVRVQGAALPGLALWFAVPWRCSLLTAPPSAAPDPEPKQERVIDRETLAEPPRGPRVRLTDDVVLPVMQSGQPLFVRCFKKAADEDPSVVSFKVVLRIELDATGVATVATADSELPILNNCLVRAAYALRFPAPGQPALVEAPLVFRPDI